MSKVLVIRLGAIGDVILTTPTLINLKLAFPQRKIILLTREHIAPLARTFAGADEVVEFPRRGTPLQLFKIAEMLDQSDLDLIIDLHGNIRSWYLSRHMAAAGKVRYQKRRWERYAAVRKGKGKRIIEPAPHTIDLYNAPVGEVGGKIYASRPAINSNALPDCPTMFSETRITVAVAPGASYPTKKWPAERFDALLSKIYNELNANLILILSSEDGDLIKAGQRLPPERIKSFVNADLTELASVLSMADLLISNDSALAHLGSAVGTPVLAIFGPTHPTLGFSPRGMKDRIIQVDEYCRPCSLHGKRPCFRDQQYCFTRISVDNVFEQVAHLLSSNARGEKALFIDRDGTLIKEKEFLSHPDEIEPEEKAVEAIKNARAAGYKIIVISNQSGVARGYFSESTVSEINRHLLRLFAGQGALIDDILYCPHLPDGIISEYAVDCDCRKPAPGMIEQACLKHNLNPFHSFVIGDKLTDNDLAAVVGARGILVRTGYGREEEAKLKNPYLIKPELIVNTFFDAVEYILRNQRRSAL
jgi:histidinol-phosphate phosphatase family protein